MTSIPETCKCLKCGYEMTKEKYTLTEKCAVTYTFGLEDHKLNTYMCPECQHPFDVPAEAIISAYVIGPIAW